MKFHDLPNFDWLIRWYCGSIDIHIYIIYIHNIFTLSPHYSALNRSFADGNPLFHSIIMYNIPIKYHEIPFTHYYNIYIYILWLVKSDCLPIKSPFSFVHPTIFWSNHLFHGFIQWLSRNYIPFYPHDPHLISALDHRFCWLKSPSHPVSIAAPLRALPLRPPGDQHPNRPTNSAPGQSWNPVGLWKNLVPSPPSSRLVWKNGDIDLSQLWLPDFWSKIFYQKAATSNEMSFWLK